MSFQRDKLPAKKKNYPRNWRVYFSQMTTSQQQKKKKKNTPEYTSFQCSLYKPILSNLILSTFIIMLIKKYEENRTQIDGYV